MPKYNHGYLQLVRDTDQARVGAADILLCLATLIWALLAVYFASPKLVSAGGHHLKWVALANIPYLLWVAFATVLQQPNESEGVLSPAGRMCLRSRI